MPGQPCSRRSTGARARSRPTASACRRPAGPRQPQRARRRRRRGRASSKTSRRRPARRARAGLAAHTTSRPTGVSTNDARPRLVGADLALELDRGPASGSSRPSSRRSGRVSVAPSARLRRRASSSPRSHGPSVRVQQVGGFHQRAPPRAAASSPSRRGRRVAGRRSARCRGRRPCASGSRRSPRRRPGSRPGSASRPDAAAAATDAG